MTPCQNDPTVRACSVVNEIEVDWAGIRWIYTTTSYLRINSCSLLLHPHRKFWKRTRPKSVTCYRNRCATVQGQKCYILPNSPFPKSRKIILPNMFMRSWIFTDPEVANSRFADPRIDFLELECYQTHWKKRHGPWTKMLRCFLKLPAWVANSQSLFGS